MATKAKAKTAKRTKVPKYKIREKLRKLKDYQRRIKALYERRDALEDEIREMLPLGSAIDLDEEIAIHRDNFAEKNVAFGHGPVRRFEIVFRKK